VAYLSIKKLRSARREVLTALRHISTACNLQLSVAVGMNEWITTVYDHLAPPMAMT